MKLKLNSSGPCMRRLIHARFAMCLLLTGASVSPGPAAPSADDIFKTAVAVWHLADLKNPIPDCFECPDFFKLPVEGDPQRTRWVLVRGDGRYSVGEFDGARFTPETGQRPCDQGANFYATQSWGDIPEQPGRRVQIAWMRGGKYPDMPFNQQLSIPCDLTLRSFPEGLRVCRLPVSEIQSLHVRKHVWKDQILKPGENLLKGVGGELFDIQMQVVLSGARELGIKWRGEAVTYLAERRTLACLGREAPLDPANDQLTLRVLTDRTSIEVFGNDGKVSLSSCFLPRAQRRALERRFSGCLSSSAPTAAKQYACRKLSLIGTEASVPTLAALLGNAELSHIARLALERIPNGAAGKALRTALPQVADRLKIGIIQFLGARGDVEAVSLLTQLLTNTNNAVAGAAATCLGHIATHEAAHALGEFRRTAPPAIRPIATDAWLLAAERLARNGRRAEALAIYRHLFTAPAESPLRWVLWSMGPKPQGEKELDSRAPIAARSWYRRTGDGGVIARMAMQDGMQFKTP